MRIIFSRKGFDSTAGGCPSPIFPDGSMLALPIPGEETAMVRYRDLTWNGHNLGDLLSRMAGADADADKPVHVDPDLIPTMRPRAPGWRPAFGQCGSAQSHLRNQEVDDGDLFLFFGLFRDVTADGVFVRGSAARHVLWGWLQIGEMLAVDAHRDRLGWAGDHPHLSMDKDPSNTLYVAPEKLTMSGGTDLPGAGAFGRFSPAQQLTAPGSTGPSTWLVPAWMHPEGRKSHLSYHGKPGRWSRDRDGVRLRSVGRGQEFVLNAEDYPEAVPWAVDLIRGTQT